MKRDDLKRKLERIEALYHRPGSLGEKQAAAIALNKLRSKLQVAEVYTKAAMQVRKYEFKEFSKLA